jgi:hypothetical protein
MRLASPLSSNAKFARRVARSRVFICLSYSAAFWDRRRWMYLTH